MRLIDADILEDELRDSVSDNSTAIYILHEAPTVQAIPIEVLDKIRAEIKEDGDKWKDTLFGDGIRYCLRIIDKYGEVKE